MNGTNTMATSTWFVASLVLLAGCAETSYTAGGAGPATAARDGAAATDPEVVVYAHKSWIGDPRDPKWITIHEVRHSIHWQTWALNPPESHKAKLMTAAKIVEFPDDDAKMKEFKKKQKDDQRTARESFRKLFDIWRNGDYATAYIGFREGIPKNNQDNHTAWFYFAESASKIGRHTDAVNGYRNTIALAPDSEEGLTACSINKRGASSQRFMRSKNSPAVRMVIPRNEPSSRRSRSPVTRYSARPATAHSRNLSSSGSRRTTARRRRTRMVSTKGSNSSSINGRIS